MRSARGLVGVGRGPRAARAAAEPDASDSAAKSAKNRICGLLTQWAVRAGVAHLRQPGAVGALADRGVPEVWRAWIAEAIAVIDVLDARLVAIDGELTRLARADERPVLLRTIPGVGWLRASTLGRLRSATSRAFPAPASWSVTPAWFPGSGNAARARRPGGWPRPARRCCAERRSRPPSMLATAETVAPALRRRGQAPRKRKRRQVCGRAQDPDRGLARLVPAAAVQARRRMRGPDRPGKLRPLRAGLRADIAMSL